MVGIAPPPAEQVKEPAGAVGAASAPAARHRSKQPSPVVEPHFLRIIVLDTMSEPTTMDQMATSMNTFGIAGLPAQVGEIHTMITSFKTSIERADGRVAKVESEVDSLRKELELVKQEQAEARAHTTTYSTSTARMIATPSQSGGWEPRTIHIRGWSPFGAGENSKLNTDETQQVQNMITEHLDEERRSRINCLAPFSCATAHPPRGPRWRCRRHEEYLRPHQYDDHGQEARHQEQTQSGHGGSISGETEHPEELLLLTGQDGRGKSKPLLDNVFAGARGLGHHAEQNIGVVSERHRPLDREH